jgi:hypothetical protein
VNAAILGRADVATEAAAEAAGLAERLRYPVGEAAALEARGAAAADAALLAEAEAAWRALRRPGDAERCAGLLSRVG